MIPFYRPWSTGAEIDYISRAIANQGSQDASFYTLACEKQLEDFTGCRKAFLTPSCTAALEMAAILCGIQAGDEVIMSSFTFPAMANAFVLRGGVPVFVDIRPDTLNIDEQLVEAAITSRTRAIVVMHYGGVACEMDVIMAIAKRHDLLVIEDAAHAIGATYKGRPLGSIGHLSALSFHKTKNLQCGEGGALLVNEESFIGRAEIVRENGTNRIDFNRRYVSRYTWIDIGSSFIMSEINAAFLFSQLQHLEHILARRRQLWQQYQDHLVPSPASRAGTIEHNGHIYHCIATSSQQRASAMQTLLGLGIQTSSHYQPLHSSNAGEKYGRAAHPLPHTNRISDTLLRLPLWLGMTHEETSHVARSYASVVSKIM